MHAQRLAGLTSTYELTEYGGTADCIHQSLQRDTQGDMVMPFMFSWVAMTSNTYICGRKSGTESLRAISDSSRNLLLSDGPAATGQYCPTRLKRVAIDRAIDRRGVDVSAAAVAFGRAHQRCGFELANDMMFWYRWLAANVQSLG